MVVEYVEMQKIESLTVTEFLDLVSTGEIGAVMDHMRFISFITNNYDSKLLLIFLEDIESKICFERESLSALYSRDPRSYSPDGLSISQQWEHENYIFNNPQKFEQNTTTEVSFLTERALEPLYKLRSLVKRSITEVKTLSLSKQVDHKAIVEKFLKPLNGVLQKEKIMTPESFEYLVDITTKLVSDETLPTMFRNVKTVRVSDRFIRYTYYRLYKHIKNGNNIVLCNKWVSLLKGSFDKFSNFDHKSIYKNFATPPPDYDNVLDAIVY